MVNSALIPKPLDVMKQAVKQNDLEKIQTLASNLKLRPLLTSDDNALLKLSVELGHQKCVEFFLKIAIKAKGFSLYQSGLVEAISNQKIDIQAYLLAELARKSFFALSHQDAPLRSFTQAYIVEAFYAALNARNTKSIDLLKKYVDKSYLSAVIKQLMGVLIADSRYDLIILCYQNKSLQKYFPKDILSMTFELENHEVMSQLLKHEPIQKECLEVDMIHQCITKDDPVTFKKIIHLRKIQKYLSENSDKVLVEAIEKNRIPMIYELLLLSDVNANLTLEPLKAAIEQKDCELVKWFLNHKVIKELLKHDSPQLKFNQAWGKDMNELLLDTPIFMMWYKAGEKIDRYEPAPALRNSPSMSNNQPFRTEKDRCSFASYLNTRYFDPSLKYQQNDFSIEDFVTRINEQKDKLTQKATRLLDQEDQEVAKLSEELADTTITPSVAVTHAYDLATREIGPTSEVREPSPDTTNKPG